MVDFNNDLKDNCTKVFAMSFLKTASSNSTFYKLSAGENFIKIFKVLRKI